MPGNLKDILSNADEPINQDQLLKYLNGELQQTQKHNLEKLAIDDPFESDALEGLEELEDNERIKLIVDDLNRNLKKRTAKKIEKRERMRIKPQWTLYFSILILLIIVVLVYLFLHFRIHS